MRSEMKMVVFSTAVVGMVAATAVIPAQADTAFFLGGAHARYRILQPFQRITNADLPEMGATYYDSAAADKTVIDYPRAAGILSCLGCPTVGESVSDGQGQLDEELKYSSGPVTVVGLSEGTLVIDAEQASLANDPNAPPAKDITFVVISDPGYRGLLGMVFPEGTYIPAPIDYTVPGPVESQYNTIVIIGKYDLVADPPDRPWNLVSTLNAVAGFQYVHGAVAFSDISDVPSENITTTTNSRGGTTTTCLVPTPQLPLTQPLRTVLPDQTVDRVDEVLRPVVDAGYSRHDDPDAVIKRPVLSGGKITLPSDTEAESASATKAESTTTAKKPKNTVRSVLSGTKPARTTSKKPENTQKKPATTTYKKPANPVPVAPVQGP